MSRRRLLSPMLAAIEEQAEKIAELETAKILRGLSQFESLAWADMESDEHRWPSGCTEWDDATAASKWLRDRLAAFEKKYGRRP